MYSDNEVSFSNLYALNNTHPLIQRSTSAVRCLKCYSALVVLPDDNNPSKESSESLTDTKDLKQPQEYVHQCNKTIEYRPYALCRCNNLGIMLDSHGTLRIYVNDIRDTHIGNAILDSKGCIVKYLWCDYSENHKYCDYKPIKDSGITFVPKVRPNIESEKSASKKLKVNDLVESLDLGAKGASRTFYYRTKE